MTSEERKPHEDTVFGPEGGPAGAVDSRAPLRKFFAAFGGYPPRAFYEAYARHERALQRVLDKESTATAQVMLDGTLRVVQHDGLVVYRPAGWKGRG